MNKLRNLRQERKLTLRELGEKTKISYSSLSAMENETRPFTQANLEILCKFFHVTSDYLLGLTDDKNGISLNKQKLSDVKLAFYNQAEALSDEQLKQVISYVEFLKSQN